MKESTDLRIGKHFVRIALIIVVILAAILIYKNYSGQLNELGYNNKSNIELSLNKKDISYCSFINNNSVQKINYQAKKLDDLSFQDSVLFASLLILIVFGMILSLFKRK